MSVVSAPAVSSSSSSSSPPASASAEPASSVWRDRLRAFYSAVSDKAQRHAAYERLFAPKLTRFIGLKNTSRERAMGAADAFFGGKSDIAYWLDGDVTSRISGAGEHLSTLITTHYKSPVPAEWAEKVPELVDQSVITQLKLRVEMETDAQGAVTSYTEHDATPHRLYRVKTATHGYSIPFAHSCWQRADDVEEISLEVGTLVEETGDSLMVFGCGPATFALRVRYGKRHIWVLQALYELVPNPNGGSSLGGVDYLEEAPRQ